MPAYRDDKRGTWYVKYSVDGKQKLKRGFRTKREALAFEASQRLAPKAVNGLVFEDLMEKYFQYSHMKEATKTAQKAILNTHITFMTRRVEEITKTDMMNWYLDLDEKDLKPSMKNLILSITKAVFRYGEDFYELKNPAKMLRKFRQSKSDFEVWTPEQFDQFIRCVKLAHYRNLFAFLYMTGCRRSEALALRYDDIEGNRCHIRGTKTKTSDRWITLPDAVVSALQPVLAQSSPERPFVFGGEEMLNKRTVQDVFKRSEKTAGVPEIRIHDLRHSFASNVIASGANIVAVSKYLGHSSINTTLSVYAHLLEETEADMIQKVNNLYQNRITAL